MRRLLIVLFLALLALNTQCGSGGGDGTFSGTTPVTIVFGEVRTGPGTTASLEKGKLVSNIVADDRIAGITVTGRELTICRITITGPGMTDMVTEVEISGQEKISETFKIRSGLNRYLLVEFIDNGNNVLFSADRAGVNLEGEPVEIEVQVEPTGTYLAPPEFPGISSIGNVETRSVRLNWEPATDNLTPQDRIQYEIYLSNESIDGREDINSVFDTVYTFGNATVLEGDPLMSYTYGTDNELLLISYDYEGVVPDKGIKSGAVNQGTSTGRLTPGLSYYFIVKAKDEFGRLDEQLVESAAVTVHMLDVTTEGSGTVTSNPPGIDCGSNCSEDYLSGNVSLIANPAPGSEFEGWTENEQCYGTDDCTLTLTENESVTASFSLIDKCSSDENEGQSCDDGQFCTEGETCQSGVCTGGSLKSCSDGVGCTDDSCDEANNTCINTPDNGNCNDSQFCNGVETCDPEADCQTGTTPCAEGTTCIESSDTCEVTCTDKDNDGYAIEGGVTCGPIDCDDENRNVHPDATEVCNGVDDNCDGSIDETFNDLGESCTVGTGECTRTGSRVCDESGTGTTCDATPGTPSEEVCDGLDNDCNGSIDETGNALCDNGMYCDGQETCGGASGCINGTPIDCNASGDQCNSGKCDEITDKCIAVPANEGQSCNDGLYCNEGETCQSGICTGGSTKSCSDGVGCTVDSCNEAIDSCIYIPDDNQCDNGLYCDGAEICDVTNDCQLGIPVECAPGNECNEETDTCEDNEPPDFSGLKSAKLDCRASPDEIDLSWPAATDNVTPQNQIRYLVCWDTVPLTYDSKTADCFEVTGQTKYSINSIDGHSLVEDQLYYVGVTPRDNAGNWAFNEVVKQVTVDCVSKPDLIVQSIQQTGPSYNTGSSILIPIRVVVKNQGTTAAPIFKVSTEYNWNGGTYYTIPFGVSGQSSSWYPYTSSSLAAGGSVTFDGFVTITPRAGGINIRALADSCSGDEFVPDPPCRVDESNEGNNMSSPISFY